MKYQACVLNTKEDLQGDIFSVEALEYLAQEAQTRVNDVLPTRDVIPVLLNFDYKCNLGHASDFVVKDNELLCTLDLTVDEVSTELVPVVGVMYRHKEGTRRDLIGLFAIGLTESPATIGTWIKPYYEKVMKILTVQDDSNN